MPAEVGLLRLAAQRLVGEPCGSPAEAVRWLTAAQAQNLPGALQSVALRTRTRSRADVVAALDRGELVRSWPMRGTLHLVAAEDLAWMVRLLAPRVMRGLSARHAQLGITADDVARAEAAAAAALSGGRALRREELFAAWETAGISTSGQRGIHLLHRLAAGTVVCFGPTTGGPGAVEQRVVLLDEWVPRPRRPGREEALAELAERYYRAHGPATVADLARWAQLTLTDARAGTAAVRDRLEVLDVEGVEHLLDPLTPQRLHGAGRQAAGVLLLPGFDEFLLGYGDRSAVLDPRFADRIAPGGNGVFRPTVVHRGRVVATWSRGTRRGDPPLRLEPFEELPPTVERQAQAELARLP